MHMRNDGFINRYAGQSQTPIGQRAAQCGYAQCLRLDDDGFGHHCLYLDLA